MDYYIEAQNKNQRQLADGWKSIEKKGMIGEEKMLSSTSGTLYVLTLNGFQLKTFIMPLVKQIIGKTGSEDKGHREILFQGKICS